MSESRTKYQISTSASRGKVCFSILSADAEPLGRRPQGAEVNESVDCNERNFSSSEECASAPLGLSLQSTESRRLKMNGK